MQNKRAWVVELITSAANVDKPTAELVVERLMEEGLLNLGYGNADVDNVVRTFTDTFGTTKVSRQDRFAAHRLVQKYGAQAVVGIVRLLAENSTEKYCPVVGSVVQLENKWVNVLSFLRNVKSDEIIE